MSTGNTGQTGLIGLPVRLVRNRLRRPRLLAGTRGLGRHRHFLDRMHRLPGLAIQDVEVSVLARLGQGPDPLSAHLHVEQHRRTARIVVPDVVMRLLEVPLQLAGAQASSARIESVKRLIPARFVLSPNGLPTATYSRPSSGSIDGVSQIPPPLRSPPTQVGPAIVPALILFVLRNGVEVPEDLAGFRVDGQHVAAGNMALASRAADVEHAVVHLRRRREPVAEADGRLDVRVSRLEHVQDHAGLAVLAEAWNRLPGLGVEREQERARRRVDHAVRVARRRGCGTRSLPALRRQ